MSGTSQAAPHVSGTAALLLSAYPHLKAGEIKAALLKGANSWVQRNFGWMERKTSGRQRNVGSQGLKSSAFHPMFSGIRPIPDCFLLTLCQGVRISSTS